MFRATVVLLVWGHGQPYCMTDSLESDCRHLLNILSNRPVCSVKANQISERGLGLSRHLAQLMAEYDTYRADAGRSIFELALHHLSSRLSVPNCQRERQEGSLGLATTPN